MIVSPEFPQFAWMPPASWETGRPSGDPLWVVLHYTAGSEGPTSAEDGAAYDARRTDGTSTHFFVDQNSVVQCVRTADRAHAAFYNGNERGIHIEMCGTAQTRGQWLDAASRPTIRNAAMVAALCLRKYAMPPTRLSVAGVAALGPKGYCDHAAITAAFPADHGDHTDVGTGFPWDAFASDLATFEGGSDMSARSDEILAALANGMPKLADGSAVSPVVWRLRDEARQREVDAWRKGVDAALAALVADVKALASPATAHDIAAELIAQFGTRS